MKHHPVLLVDVGAVPDCHCNDAFEAMFKAHAEDGGDLQAMWAPHENPYLTAHVEDSYRRLARALEQIQDALARIMLGEPIGHLSKAAVPWMRWDPTRFELVAQELETKPPALFTLDDWLLLAEYLVQRYLPDGVIQDEAEFLVVRASIMGKIQASQGNIPPAPDMMAAWTLLTPTTFAHVPPRLLAPVELQIMEYAKARAATHISAVADSARTAMRSIIVEHVQAQVLGQKEGTAAILKTRLFDAFGVLNRDFRRIAVTEAGECCNQGFIGAAALGSRVKRMEAYRGACGFCRSINGRIFEVVSPDYADRDGQTQVWVSKTNVGRSGAKRRRVGDSMVERSEGERWWPAAGLQHPNCRGAWVYVADTPPGVSPEFASFMAGLLAKHRLAMAINDPTD